MTKSRFIIMGIVFVFSVGAIAAAPETGRKNGKKNRTVQTSQGTPLSEYDKLFDGKDHKAAGGFMTLHKVEDKIYIELPHHVLEKRMLLGTTVEAVSDPNESAPGIQPQSPVQVMFVRNDSTVLLCGLRDGVQSREADANIEKAIRKSYSTAVMESYRIKALSPDSSSVVFDATPLFVGDDPELNPFDPKAYNTMGGYVKRKTAYKSSASMAADVMAFDDNASVLSYVSYDVSLAFFGVFTMQKDKPFTAKIKRTFMLLPEEPMRPRIADSRVGTKVTGYTEYSEGAQGTRPLRYANRWRLEPADPEAWPQGGLSEPVTPITFYIDRTFPESWDRAIRSAFAEWNKTFEGIGYKNVLRIEEFPADDSFDVNNIRYSCIRYVTSPLDEIRDNIWCDPRTGEIISANIYVCHNLPAQIQVYGLLQSAAADPEARRMCFTDEKIAEILSAFIMRNIGRCLGLEDNMAGSHAYDTGLLRSGEFTRACGLSASVMDQFRYNYIADGNDFLNGASMLQFSPGPYDYHAIRWLYAGISGAESPRREADSLRKWIAEKAGDPVYRYGRVQSAKAFYDPRGMAQDLGNDAIASCEAAFRNMAYVIAHADQWLDREDYDYSYRASLYDYVLDQIYEHVKHVFMNIGGIYLNEKYEGDTEPSYIAVPAELQRESLLWIMSQLEDMSWIDNGQLLKNGGLQGSVADFCQKYFSNFIFIQIGEMWLSESKYHNPYTQQDAMQDVIDRVMRHAKKGTVSGDYVRYMEGLLVEQLISLSGVADKPSETSSKPTAASIPGVNSAVMPESRSYAQPFTGISYGVKPDKRHVWYRMLLEVRTIVDHAAMSARTEDLRTHYRYLSHRIGSSLKTD